MSASSASSRRGFLRTSAASVGGLLVSFSLPGGSSKAATTASTTGQVNAFIRINPDDTVTFAIHKAEMGQGTVTSLSMLLAEELGCDWRKVHTEFPAPSPAFGPMMGVFGSQSIRTSWTPLRKAGATAREMLVATAADEWHVSRSDCRAENGVVINTKTNERRTYGSLASAAAQRTAPANVTLKPASEFKLIGTSPKRLDTPSKTDGSAMFGIDARLPGMLYAVLERCPVFGGTVASFDDTKAKAVPGVKHVVQISNGVAVVADNTWSAMQGRRALTVQWDEGKNANVSSASIRQLFVDLVAKPGAVARQEGDADAALQSASSQLHAIYEAPYLAHAPMEPLSCTAHVRADSCDVYASTQIQTAALGVTAKITGLPPNKINVHTLYLGGGFGRRGGADYIAEAVETAKAVGVPVKLTWTREDDIQHDIYRPASYTTFTAGLNEQGQPVALTARIACPSFAGLRGGIDHAAVEGIADLPYGIPNMRVEYHAADAGIPTGYWRSVGYSQNTFFAECFIDELAAAAKLDPVEFRRRYLAPSQPRLLNVLNVAADRAGWNQPLPAGRYRGVALVNNIGSYNAQVAEISINPQGKIRVRRVVCAVDCGYVVNPAGVEQQIQSGIVYGLTAALKGKITLDHGRVQQTNFHQYEMLRVEEMPHVEVHLVKSDAAPGGIGEASTPPVAAAVANAIFAAKGQRLRTLPLSLA